MLHLELAAKKCVCNSEPPRSNISTAYSMGPHTNIKHKPGGNCAV